jgi:dCMP deaminase
MMDKWDRYFLGRAQAIASMSKDPSTKCGAVIVRTYPDRAPKGVSEGYNGFPPGCDDSPDIYANRELKYSRVNHAELNAIIAAEQSVRGCTMYTWPGGVGPSCDRCTAAIIQAGITTVKHLYVEPTPGDFNERWAAVIQIGLDMYKEAGIEVVQLAETNDPNDVRVSLVH